jgi:hypothetical protein
MTSIHIPPDLPFPSVRRVRLMAYLFRQVFFNLKNGPTLTSKMHPPLEIVPKN